MDGIGWTAREVSNLDNEERRAVAANHPFVSPSPIRVKGPQ